jgi:hypothetical protein
MTVFKNLRLRKLVSIGFLLILLLLSPGCDKLGNNQISGPEIEWITGGTSITYTYSAGVLSGYYFHRSFVVGDESGEVVIEVQVENDKDTRVTKTINAEAGFQYSVKVKGSRNGSQGSSPGAKCLNVVFSSPNCHTTQVIDVDSYLVSTGPVDNYYCPTSLDFGEIELVDKK